MSAAIINADANDDDEYEEEETLLYVDLDSILPTEELQEERINFKVIGIASENPILQINNKLFKGECAMLQLTDVC